MSESVSGQLWYERNGAKLQDLAKRKVALESQGWKVIKDPNQGDSTERSYRSVAGHGTYNKNQDQNELKKKTQKKS